MHKKFRKLIQFRTHNNGDTIVIYRASFDGTHATTTTGTNIVLYFFFPTHFYFFFVGMNFDCRVTFHASKHTQFFNVWIGKKVQIV